MLSLGFTGTTITTVLQEVAGPVAHEISGGVVLPAFLIVTNSGTERVTGALDLHFTIGRPTDQTHPMPTPGGAQPSDARSGLALSIVENWLGGSGGWEAVDGDPDLEYIYPTCWFVLSSSGGGSEAALDLDAGQSRALQLGFRVVWRPGAAWASTELRFPVSVDLLIAGEVSASESTSATIAPDRRR